MQEKAFGNSGQFVLEISSHCLPFLKLLLMLPARKWTGFTGGQWPPNDYGSLKGTQLPSISVSKLQMWAWRNTVSLTNGTIPNYFHSGRALRLLFFPLGLIPVQFVEHDHQGWHQIQMLIHPACLQDPFGNVPFIRSSLQTLAKAEKRYSDNKSSRNHLLWSAGTFSVFISFNIHTPDF